MKQEITSEKVAQNQNLGSVLAHRESTDSKPDQQTGEASGPPQWWQGTNADWLKATEPTSPKTLIQNAEAWRKVALRYRDQSEELLQALRAIIDMVTDNRTHGPEIDKACSAIARAEGKQQQ